MLDQPEEKTPLIYPELLPALIRKATEEGNFTTYLALLSLIENKESSWPMNDCGKNHDEIITAINDGCDMLVMVLQTAALGAECTLQIDLAEFMKEEDDSEIGI